MLKEGIGGFCMALADSVPGVSGGTVAFIMGFYDNFIGSIHGLVFGKKEEKVKALRYLIKLGIGWIIGMGMAVLVLSALFENHIYIVSSLFLGFVAGSIPLIMREEKESLREVKKGIVFCVIGIAIVVMITWLNGRIGSTAVDLGQFSAGLGIRMFLIGMVAISAMFLPGISGSTLLLIFGVYMPVISAVRGVLGRDFAAVPVLMCFAVGILAGVVSVVKMIRIGLERFRPQMVYLILGMMLGSFYAIVQGPTTLSTPQPAINFGNFHLAACLAGIVIVVGMQILSGKNKTR